ncbi:hypothetical protein RhiirA5_419791 [Rhizophagus irregularis]|uniref:Uncharacterized protein n=1 Tax=Rhizophagus irregularis TaxID=588596 RepID=A0A2N0PHI3_9GLOM|nr:hypothetical protein RhiirA5_419791 [Rhizophagus irregularis]CAB4492717.1 unnamed protein product [Rhizophagus irregularis]
MKVIKLNRKWEEDYLNLHVRVLVVKLTIYNFFKPTESQHIESSDDDDLLTIDEAEEGEINENVDNLLTDNEFLSNLNKSGKRLIWKGLQSEQISNYIKRTPAHLVDLDE